MIKIFGHKSTEAIFLSKDTLNIKFKDRDYFFLHFNKLKINQIQKIFKYKNTDKKVIVMINNFKVNDFKRLNKNICLNKINITIILPIFQNYQKK